MVALSAQKKVGRKETSEAVKVVLQLICGPVNASYLRHGGDVPPLGRGEGVNSRAYEHSVTRFRVGS
jgi:hypothetical protein